MDGPAAIILLLVGGFTIIGWFVGVVLLWISDVCSTRDKLIGTLVVPGGLAGALGVTLAADSVSCEVSGPVGAPVRSCVSDPSTFGSFAMLILAVLILIAPIGTAIYLSLRLHRVHPASDPEDLAAEARD